LQKLERKIRNKVHKIFKFFLKNKTNSPYISGDSIANLTELKIKSLEAIKYDKVVSAKSIFVEGHLLLTFLDKFGRILENKTVISGNSDFNLITLPSNFTNNFRLFCQNNILVHHNIFTLPIGIENLRLGRSGFKYHHKPINKFRITSKVLIPPMSATNPVRTKVTSFGKLHASIFDVHENYLSKKDYFNLIRNYKFILVCEGNGFDTHRMWEVLYQNSFPVVIRSNWTETLNWLKLPILSVDKIEDISSTLLELHLEKYKNFESKKTKALWTPYWKDLFSITTKSEN
jgi:hypothetical protein